MRSLDKARLRLRSLFRRPRVDAELDAELRFHLDQLVEENISSGMPPAKAHKAALRALGGVTQFKEECRERRGVHLIENLAQDVRYAVRTLTKAPVFTAVVVATLALGIGGITAVFSLVQAVLLAPLPYESPGQLVRFYQQQGTDASTRHFLSGAHFREIRERAASFEHVAALDNYHETGLDLVQDGQAHRLRVLAVTSDYFSALRAGPMRGRDFEPLDERGERLVVLSDDVWRNRFNADPSLIGKTIRLSAEQYVVTGIAPAGLKNPLVDGVDAWLPYRLVKETDPENYGLSAIGRLRRGVTIEQARAEITALSRALAERWPAARLNLIVMQPLKNDLVARSRGMLSLLSIAVGLVLLVACLNVANLLLLRATGRAREFAIRSALGSGGFRIARQLLVESVVLAGAGGIAGLALAVAALDVLRTLGAEAIPRLQEVGLDPTVLAVTTVITLATGFAFGILPAARFARIDPRQAFHQQSRTSTGGRGQERLRGGLAAIQVALALTLLVGAGVLTASFYRLQQISLGFRADRVLTFDVNLPSAVYDAGRRAASQEELSRRLESIPGVEAAGGISRLPGTGPFHPWATRPLGGPLAGTDFRLKSQQRVVSGNFFSAAAIRVLAGRVFDARDDAGAPARAVVSANFARQAFPGMPLEDALGQRIRILGLERLIVGVVGDVTLDSHGSPAPAVYHAHRQFAANRNWALTQYVATAGPPDQILAAVRREVASLDPQLAVYNAAPMTEVVNRGVARERFALVLMAAFAVVALALAAVGLYGVLAFSVRQRTREIGIRMALGATAAQVRLLVLRQAAGMIAIGVAAGIAGAFAIGRWLTSVVHETSPSDPRVFAASTVLLTGVALVSAWLPAWRASRVEPQVTIHEE